MSNFYQRGDARPVMLPVTSGQAVTRGMAVALNSSGQLARASETTWTTDLATTRGNFITHFAGIAAQDKDAGKAVFGNGTTHQYRLRADTGGVQRMACSSATYALGDLVGPSKQTSANLLDDSILEKVSSLAQAIGRVVGGDGDNVTSLEVEILSSLFPVAR